MRSFRSATIPCLTLSLACSVAAESVSSADVAPADAMSPWNTRSLQPTADVPQGANLAATQTETIAALQRQLAELQRRVAELEAAQRTVIPVQFAGVPNANAAPAQPQRITDNPPPVNSSQPQQVNGVQFRIRLLGNGSTRANSSPPDDSPRE